MADLCPSKNFDEMNGTEQVVEMSRLYYHGEDYEPLRHFSATQGELLVCRRCGCVIARTAHEIHTATHPKRTVPNINWD